MWKEQVAHEAFTHIKYIVLFFVCVLLALPLNTVNRVLILFLPFASHGDPHFILFIDRSVRFVVVRM